MMAFAEDCQDEEKEDLIPHIENWLKEDRSFRYRQLV